MITIKKKVTYKDMEMEVGQLIYLLHNIKHPVTVSLYYKEDKD